jgi:hypothetical protein
MTDIHTDTIYVRTDEELAYQRTYETRETSRHRSTVQIYYRIITGKPPGNVILRKIGWRVGRQAGEEKEEISQWFFRHVEAIDHVAQHTKRDKDAAQRLGMHVHLTVSLNR